MENLLTQIRDNLRLSNWTMFPGNSIEYIYNENVPCGPIEIHYYRNGVFQFSVHKTYEPETCNLVRETYHQIKVNS